MNKKHLGKQAPLLGKTGARGLLLICVLVNASLSKAPLVLEIGHLCFILYSRGTTPPACPSSFCEEPFWFLGAFPRGSWPQLPFPAFYI